MNRCLLLFLLCVACTRSTWASSGGLDERLVLLRTITAGMFETGSLGKDSCIHVRMKIVTEPREGDRMEQEAEMFTGRTSALFKSDLLEEYIDRRTHVRIWPEDRMVMLTNSAPGTLQQTQELMLAVNNAITEKARIIRSRTYSTKEGVPMLFLELGGKVVQQVEIDLREQAVRSIILLLPGEHPLRRCSVQYLQLGQMRMPGPGPFIKALLSERGPVTKYRDHTVRDLRNKP